MRTTNATRAAGLALALSLSSIAFREVPAQAAPTVGSPTKGKWTKPFPWAGVAIHLHVQPDGHVLTWSREDSTMKRGEKFAPASIWDPATGGFTDVSLHGTNVFCSGHSFLPDGRLLVIGGHIHGGVGPPDVNVFSFETGLWTAGAPMNAGRWYPTGVTLADGEALALSGSNENGLNTLPQVRRPNGTWRDLTGAPLPPPPSRPEAAAAAPGGIDHLPLYPRAHVAPDGRVFVSGMQRTTRYLDTSGTGRWTDVGDMSVEDREYGSSVLYDAGKILAVGGGDPPTRTAETIDLIRDPVWRAVQSMAFARRQLNATILADGKVLVTGGTKSTGFNRVRGAILPAEIWDPATGSWTTAASMSVPRLYHSTAALLPDARVLSAGGGMPPAIDGDVDHPDAEIFSPPYLFGPDGKLASRPRITSAPGSVTYGETFTVGSPQAAAIAKVTWIGISSVTHAFNVGQRFLPLAFTRSGTTLHVTAPAAPALSPPGHYLLFLVNGSGVPSIAKIVRIG